jgi:Zn-dependent protease
MGGLLSFRLFGFPVTIHGSFLLLIAFLAYSGSPEVADFVGFALIALVAILVHELGHAVAARAQGSVTTPMISLEGWGGLTRYRLAAVPSRAQSILITAAGPLAGIAMGVVVLLVRNSGVVEDTSFTRYLFNVGLFTTFGWSVFNLFPIVPLDGGHIMAELLPGSPVQRRRRAAVISAVFGTIAAIVLWMWSGSLFGPIILGMLVYQNLSVFNTSRGNRVAAPPLSPREP